MEAKQIAWMEVWILHSEGRAAEMGIKMWGRKRIMSRLLRESEDQHNIMI